MMRTSEFLSALAPALVKAQAEFPVIERKKNGRVGPREYKYADIADVLNVVKPILKTHGLSIIQLPTTTGEKNVLSTMILHESGEYIEGELDLGGNTLSQALGSAITYARRYSLSGALNLATEEDLDGAGGGGMRGSDTNETGLRPEVQTLKARLFDVSPDAPARKAFVVKTLGLFGEEELGSLEEMSEENVMKLLKAIDDLLDAPAS